MSLLSSKTDCAPWLLMSLYLDDDWTLSKQPFQTSNCWSQNTETLVLQTFNDLNPSVVGFLLIGRRSVAIFVEGISKMVRKRLPRFQPGYVSLSLFISVFVNVAVAVTHYSIPEEMEEGSVVANLATDLGLDVKTLHDRKMRVDVVSNKKYLDINKDTGELFILDRIDREFLCPLKTATSCFLKLDAAIENPERMFNIEVEIMDINDNAPHFRRGTMHLAISESSSVGERFSLNNAADPDVGSNSVKDYHLSASEHFSINIQTGRDGTKFADLILTKALDRELQAVHNLILTAVDGGVPTRTGTASIVVRVLDVNDNAPSFGKDKYVVDVMENSPIGSLVIKLNATDLDEGSNSDVVYSYSLYTSERTQQIFNLNAENGEIRVREMINYEDLKLYEMEIIASDKGTNLLTGQCKVTIQVTDMNDNHPEISIKSFQSPVKENIDVDTVIAVVSVSDKDSGDNGVVDLHIPDKMPFKLRQSSDNYYELVVSEPLDREKVPEYDITFTVTDRGSPPLSDNETMTLELLDINDNVPHFPQSFYTIRVTENNAPGALLSSLTAFDPDLHENQYLVYFILEKEIANTSMSMLFSINPEDGNLYGLKTFDYEIEKEFLFHIEARDSGSPPLSSNVSVHIIIVDQNDNAPVIVSPWRAQGSVVEEKIPRSTDKGSLVAKVIALDVDSVHNSRITYQLLQVTDATLFSLDQYNGEIRTMRMFSYRDPRHQRLVVVAKDNGNPALSATVTIKLSTVETAVKAYSDLTEVPLEYDIFSDLNLYLVIGLGSVSFLLLITILVTIVIKCQKPKASKAAPPCRNSVISERNSTIADSTLVSNDAYWYSLFLAETRKGKLVVRQPVPKGSRYIVSSIPRGTGMTDTSGSAPSTLQPKMPSADWRYSASLRAGGVMQSSVHMEESSVMQGAQGVLVQNWPTASSAADAEGGEVSPPMGAGVDSNSWHFRYGPGGPGAPPQHLKPGEVPPEAFIIPGSPAIISIRQNQGGEDDKSDFITFGKKEEAKKKKKKKKEKKDKKDKGKDDGDE
uniref:Protocadherin 2A6 n=1 Tax=Takifugu rubripes TaxID=31033 RepID=A4KCH0_TAKRU|nr:protocadherin 2A6 [Takifugu rubripes]